MLSSLGLFATGQRLRQTQRGARRNDKAAVLNVSWGQAGPQSLAPRDVFDFAAFVERSENHAAGHGRRAARKIRDNCRWAQSCSCLFQSAVNTADGLRGLPDVVRVGNDHLFTFDGPLILGDELHQLGGVFIFIRRTVFFVWYAVQGGNYPTLFQRRRVIAGDKR